MRTILERTAGHPEPGGNSLGQAETRPFGEKCPSGRLTRRRENCPLMGYPYFLQEWGYEVWNYAAKSPIRLADVKAVTPQVISKLDQNFFRVRFDRLTPSEKRYPRAR